MIRGKASIEFKHPPHILSTGTVAGKKEGEGPLGPFFDLVEEDSLMGQETWEAAESYMQKQSATLAMDRGQMSPQQIRYALAGDLLGQLIATSFGLKELDIPLLGLYGACSTMGEALGLGAMMVDGGYAEHVLCVASSHFASSEKEFRFPLGYGNQRPESASWTVTGSGAVILGTRGGRVKITGMTTGRIVDLGIKDSMNMGAAMAPAAADLIMQNFIDFDRTPESYDRIYTGDLGSIGRKAMLELLKEEGVCIEGIHRDCGIEIFHSQKQDTHAGGSGCGCSALVLCSLILPKIAAGTWKRVLFLPTGALLSTVSFNEGKSVPGIAHGVVLETVGKGE